jgi:protein phosphatase
VAELAESGFIAEATSHPQKYVIWRALGPQAGVEMDLFEWKLQPGDKLLLCSDGLWKNFPDTAELSYWLSSAASPEELCWQLVAEASSRDDSDDISVVIVQTNEQLE